MTKEEVLKIIGLVLDVNEFQPRKRDITGDVPAAWFSYCMSCASIEISVYEKGWGYGVRSSRNYSFGVDKPLDKEYFNDYETYMKSLIKKAPAPTKVTGTK